MKRKKHYLTLHVIKILNEHGKDERFGNNSRRLQCQSQYFFQESLRPLVIEAGQTGDFFALKELKDMRGN